MSARENILKAVNKNKPELAPLPDLVIHPFGNEDPIGFFKVILEKMGGTHVDVSNYEDIVNHIKSNFTDHPSRFSSIKEIDISTFDANAVSDPHDLEVLDLVVLKGQFAVAENASIWLSEKDMIHRALPFITQHLALVINVNTILPNLHYGYAKAIMDKTSYGAFIAGPSKTADIEQSLVVGAHGPRSLVVYILG